MFLVPTVAVRRAVSLGPVRDSGQDRLGRHARASGTKCQNYVGRKDRINFASCYLDSRDLHIKVALRLAEAEILGTRFGYASIKPPHREAGTLKCANERQMPCREAPIQDDR